MINTLIWIRRSTRYRCPTPSCIKIDEIYTDPHIWLLLGCNWQATKLITLYPALLYCSGPFITEIYTGKYAWLLVYPRRGIRIDSFCRLVNFVSNSINMVTFFMIIRGENFNISIFLSISNFYSALMLIYHIKRV